MKNNEIMYLSHIKSAIENAYQLPENYTLEENNIDSKGNPFCMQVDIKGCKGLAHLACRFDVENDLFPYFQNKEGYKKMCDYIVFAENAAKVYVFLVELKNSQESPQRQLVISKPFAEFLMSRIKKVDNLPHKEIVYRMIGIKQRARASKKTTKGFINDYLYDSDGYLLLPRNDFMDLCKLID